MIEQEVRVPWCSAVYVLEDSGPVRVQARELGRSTMLLQGEFGLTVGRELTIEFELLGETVHVLALVDAAILVHGVVLTRLRLGTTSPRGNDLIRAHVAPRLTVPPVRYAAAA